MFKTLLSFIFSLIFLIGLLCLPIGTLVAIWYTTSFGLKLFLTGVIFTLTGSIYINMTSLEDIEEEYK